MARESSMEERSKGDRNGDELVAEAKQVETGTRLGIPADTQPRGELNGLALVGFGLPVAFLFWLIHIDAVNMLRADQWDAIRLIQHSDSGTLSLGVLWAQHTENRIFFQNLITLLLAHTTNFNILVEDYVSGALLVVAAAVPVVTHRRRSPSRPWIFYCPVVIVMLSAVVWGITLFGFQIGWSLILLSLAGTLYLLDRSRSTGLVLAAAIAAAVVGCFSSLEGLIIWPAGLVLLCQRHRSRRQMTAFARAHRLAMFSTAAAVVYLKEGLPKTPPTTNVTSPHDGETLKGPQWLLAAATDEYGVSKVEFEFTGKGRGSTLIGPAALILFGWIGRWSTASVPDGTYTLRSVAYGASGGVSSSPGVAVHVEN